MKRTTAELVRWSRTMNTSKMPREMRLCEALEQRDTRNRALTSVLTYIRKDWSSYLATSNLELFIERMKRNMDDADHALLTPASKRISKIAAVNQIYGSGKLAENERIKIPKPDGVEHDLLEAAQRVLKNWDKGDLAGAVRELAVAARQEKAYRKENAL